LSDYIMFIYIVTLAGLIDWLIEVNTEWPDKPSPSRRHFGQIIERFIPNVCLKMVVCIRVHKYKLSSFRTITCITNVAVWFWLDQEKRFRRRHLGDSRWPHIMFQWRLYIKTVNLRPQQSLHFLHHCKT